VVGALSLGGLVLRDDLRLPLVLGVVVGCFGSHGLALPAASAARDDAGWRVAVRHSASVGAAVAGIAAGLLTLAAIFGGSIEVMRR